MTVLGFDLMHINLHKTFATPHGGGGPVQGPSALLKCSRNFYRFPVVEKENGEIFFNIDRPDSIGRVHSFYGNFPRDAASLYGIIRALGADGIRNVSGQAVLNANYLLSRLKKIYTLPIERICKHEFVISDAGMPNGITTQRYRKTSS